MACREPLQQFLDFLIRSIEARDAGDLLGTLMYAMDAQDVAAEIDPVLVKLADSNLERVREAIDEQWSRTAGGPVRPSRDIQEMDHRAVLLEEQGSDRLAEAQKDLVARSAEAP